MDLDWLRAVCLRLPNVTEQIQWGSDLLFKVHGKMFAVACTEPARVCLSFKCSEEKFAELIERPEVIPAPYLARAKWVALQTPQAIGREELAELLKDSYEMVLAKVPKSKRSEKAAGLSSPARRGGPAKNAGAPGPTKASRGHRRGRATTKATPKRNVKKRKKGS
jgi:predicted DNA-binding protein (MmcQ/YjbR family)